MAKPLLIRKRAKVVALIVFFLGIILISLLDAWWPGVMLTVGVPLAIWQYLQGRIYDMAITLFVFLGAFFTVQFNIRWQVLLPILFTIGGIYIFFREWLESKSAEEEEQDDKLRETENKKKQ